MTSTPPRSQLSPNNVFSPIQLKESPAAVSPQKQLVGYPRLARDIAADTYNSIQHWNTLHIKGAEIIKQIVLLKCGETNIHPDGLESLTENLIASVNSLSSITNLFQEYNHKLESIKLLNKSEAPLFISWPVQKMCDVLFHIANAYTQEYKLKRFIADNVAHIHGNDKLMFYAACWTYQPYITTEINIYLESFLTETGHRTK